MDYLKKLINDKPHVALSIPALLCFFTFCTNLFTALTDGKIDANELSALLSTADGFETVVLFIVMLVLRSKKK